MIIFMFFLIFFCPLVYSTGLIHNWDYTVDYANTGFLKVLSFGFSLQNGISTSDYIKIKFPFALHTSATITNDFSVYLKLVGTSGCTPVQTTSTNIFLSLSDSNTYYIQFLDEKGQINKPLAANSWYILKFQLNVALSVGKGNYPPVQIFTVSAMTSTAIIYDYNKVFANIEISDSPSVGTLHLSTTIASPNKNDIDAIYNVIFDIAPSVDISGQARIYILSQNNAWTFNGDSCISVDQNVSQTFSNGTNVNPYFNPQLNSSQFSCSIDSVNNIVVIQLNTSFIALSHYVFSVSVRNPKFVIQNGRFEVRSLLSSANKLIEVTVDSLLFSINPLTWGTSFANLKVFLGWGVDQSQTNLPAQFQFYRGSAAVNPFKFYNAIKFVFSPSYETGTGIMLKVVLRLDAESGFEVLAGSISENLPNFGDSKVYCALDSTALAFKVTCYNVGVLSNLSNYHIGLKAFFPYSASSAVLNSNFGNLAIYTYNSLLGAYDTLPLIAEGRSASVSYNTQNNLAGAITLNPTNCYTSAHTEPAGAITDVSSTNCAIKTNSKYQNLVFSLTPTPAQIYGTGGFSSTAGYMIYTTHFIQESTTYDATDPIIDGGNAIASGNTAGDTILARAGHDDTVGRKWTWFKAYASSNLNLNSFQWTANHVFGVQNIKVISASGNYAEDTCFDFYVATYNNIVGVTPTLISTFAFNSYAISDNYIGMGDNSGVVKLAIVNFWTGNPVGQGSLIGDKFPLFIRVTGYLDSTHMTNVKKLAVFFDNLQYYSSSTSNAVDVVDCASSMSSTTTCHGYKGQATNPLLLNSLHNLNRIEIDVEGVLSGTSKASPFQILIPMKSIENIGNINLQFATMTNDYFYGIYKPYTSILNTFNTFYSSSFTPSTYASIINTVQLTNIDYKLSFSGPPGVGKTASPNPATINCGHDDSDAVSPLVNFNSAPYFGGGFTYISEYNMMGNGFFVSGTLLDTQITSERCLPFHYTYLTTVKYGFFCPFSQNSISSSSFLSALNFVFPYQNGQRIVSNTYGTWSDKTGKLISYQLHDYTSSELFQAGVISLIGTGVTPLLIKGFANQQVNFTFTTSNPIPINGKVKVTFGVSTWTFIPDVTEKCLLKANLLANDRAHTCTMTKLTNSYIYFTFSPSTSDLTPFPPGSYSLIEYGVDKDNTNGINLAFTLETYTSLGYLIDRSSALAGTLKFSNIANPAQLLISNLVFQTSTIGFRDDFSFQFQVLQKTIFFNEKIYMDLGALSSNTLSPQVYCTIEIGSSMSFSWRTFDLSSLRGIVLVPKSDIYDPNEIYTVNCAGIYIPTINTPGMILSILHGTTVVKASSFASYPAFQTVYNSTLASPNISFTKNVNFYGQMTELVFSFLLQLDLNSSHSIVVNLPIQYNSKDFCSCFINEMQVFCYYPRIHSIIIEGLDLLIPANTFFNLTIRGIMNPELTSSILSSQTTFTIGFNQSNDPNLLTFIAEVTDVSNQISQVNPLLINSAIFSNPYVLNFSNMTINFNYFPMDISVGQFLRLDFPDSETFGSIVQRTKNMTCSLINQDTGINILQTSKCILRGLSLIFALQTTANQSSYHSLIIKNLPTPEYVNCNIKKPVIYILDSDNVTVLYRTNAVSANIPVFYAKQDATLEYFTWQNSMTGSAIKHNQDVFIINIGMISNIIGLFPNTKAFFKFVGIDVYKNLISTNNSLWPVLFQSQGAKIGDLSYNFRIGCPSNMSQQILEFYLYKIEPGSTSYSNLEQISLSIIQNTYSIQPSQFSTSIAILGFSLPILFDFTENCPYTYLLVHFTIQYPSTDLGFAFIDTNTVNLTANVSYSKPIIKLQIISNTNISIGATTYGQIVVTFIGGDVTSYAIPIAPILLQPTYGDINGIPTLSIFYSTSSLQATQQTLTVTVSETSSLYCYIALVLTDSPNRDFNYTQTMADIGYILNDNDRYQEQFLVWYVQDYTASYTFTLNNLRSKKSYAFSCWAMNLFKNISVPNTGTFSTMDNGGKLMRFGLTLRGDLSGYQKQQIGCFLSMYFAIPCQNVQSYDGYYCPYTSYKDLLSTGSNSSTVVNTTSTNKTNTTNNTNTTNKSSSTSASSSTSSSSSTSASSSTTSNITNTTKNTTSNTTTNNSSNTTTTNATINTTTNAITNTTTNITSNSTTNTTINYTYTSMNFYFMPLDNRESDSSFNLVTQETQKSYFNKILAGNLSNILNISYVQPIAEVSEILPEFDTTMTINSTIGGTWLSLTGLRMKSRGFILISIELDVDLRPNTTNSTNSTNNTNSSKTTNNTNTTNSTNNTNSSKNSNTTNSSTTNGSNSSSSSSIINIFGGRILQSSSNATTINTNPSTNTAVANSSNSSNSNNISNDSLVLFKPTPAQIKLKLDSYNNSILLSRVAFYNYTDANLNITGLNYSTIYRVYYTVSSENPAVYCLLGSEVKSMRVRTLDQTIISKFLDILKYSAIYILLILGFIFMNLM